MNPFASKPDLQARSLGEVALIRRLKAALGPANPPPPQGIGDDCSVYRTGHDTAQLVTADPIIYGKHFDDDLTPEQAAAKLLKRNLSDIAAMGGIPRIAIVSLALPPELSIEWLERAYAELGRLATRYRVSVTGGDVSGADNFLGLFLTLIGEMPSGCAPLLRHRAVAGSPLYVTGSLGGSRLKKHYDFEPRLTEGAWLAQQPEVVSCSDVSDGIGKDLANTLAPECAGELDASAIPISDDARALAQRSGQPPLYHACNDGEDFELVFALAPDADTAAFETRWAAALATPLARIGQAVARGSDDAPRLRLLGDDQKVIPLGYEHLGEA